jgi:hypothetical protein
VTKRQCPEGHALLCPMASGFAVPRYPEPREKNALEGALRGARLRLAREAYACRRCAMQSVTRGAARALRAKATAY